MVSKPTRLVLSLVAGLGGIVALLAGIGAYGTAHAVRIPGSTTFLVMHVSPAAFATVFVAAALAAYALLGVRRRRT